MFLDLVKKNRSYRGYDPSFQFTEKDLLDLVEVTRFVPSSTNLQPLKYSIVWEKETADKIFPETMWAGALPQMKLPHPGEEPTGYIVICQDTSIDKNIQRFWKDVGIVAQTMLLAAVEKGLGGIMIGSFNAGNVSSILNLPNHLLPQLIVALGKPDEDIVLEDYDPEKGIKYYRDENDVHHVPKRTLDEIVIRS